MKACLYLAIKIDSKILREAASLCEFAMLKLLLDSGRLVVSSE